MDKQELLLASLDKQHMLKKASMASVVSRLCGLQAQFANNPGHALRFRAHDFSAETWRKGLVKTWTFRHTMHVVRKNELGLFLSAHGIPEEWDDSWGIPGALKPLLSASLLACLRDGCGGRRELRDRCRDMGTPDEMVAKVFHGWGGLLKEMCQRGLAAYAPGTEKRFIVCDNLELMDRDLARAKLLGRYFRHLGPATMADCAAFTGYSRKAIEEVLRKYPLPLKSVHCDGKDYWYLGKWDSSQEFPSCLFLAGFDQLVMAYKDRSRIIDDKHRPFLTTNTGIVHPTILVDGRLKAKWRKNGETLEIAPFTRLTARHRRRIDETGRSLFGEEIREVVIAT